MRLARQGTDMALECQWRLLGLGRLAAAKKQNQDPSTRVSRADEYAREPSLAQDDSLFWVVSGIHWNEDMTPICYKHQLAWASSSVRGLWIVLPDTTCTPSSLTWAPASPWPSLHCRWPWPLPSPRGCGRSKAYSP